MQKRNDRSHLQSIWDIFLQPAIWDKIDTSTQAHKHKTQNTLTEFNIITMQKRNDRSNLQPGIWDFFAAQLEQL